MSSSERDRESKQADDRKPLLSKKQKKILIKLFSVWRVIAVSVSH